MHCWHRKFDDSNPSTAATSHGKAKNRRVDGDLAALVKEKCRVLAKNRAFFGFSEIAEDFLFSTRFFVSFRKRNSKCIRRLGAELPGNSLLVPKILLPHGASPAILERCVSGLATNSPYPGPRLQTSPDRRR